MSSLKLFKKFLIGKLPITYLDEAENETDKLHRASKIKFGQEGILKVDTSSGYFNTLDKSFYNLNAAMFLKETEKLDYAQYIEEARKYKFGIVNISDRNNILRYLRGETIVFPDPEGDNLVIGKEKSQRRDEDSLTELSQPASKKYAADPKVKKLLNMEVKLHKESLPKMSLVNLPDGFLDFIDERLIKDKPRVSSAYIDTNGPPIIIVPANYNATVTIWNVKNLLEGKGYECTLNMRDAGIPKPKEVTITRPDFFMDYTYKKAVADPELPKQYIISDSANGVPPDQWDRVAAIFVQGKQWQLNNYKYTTPEELLEKGGALFNFYDSKAKGYNPEFTQGWPCGRFDIAELKNNEDKQRYNEMLISFWTKLEAHLRKIKPAYVKPVCFWD